jgi:hypothetical protein
VSADTKAPKPPHVANMALASIMIAHLPRPGGPWIEIELDELLVRINDRDLDPYAAHLRYEALHPFMDGNGRSGRAIWAWHMQREWRDPFALPFLHRFYYQALDASSERIGGAA